MSRKNRHLKATITVGSVLEASVKRNVGFLKSGLKEVGGSIKEVERRQRELDRQRNVLRRQGQSVAHLDREYEQLERTLIDLRRAQERWNRTAAASRRVGASFRDMATDIGRNARRLAIGATLAGGAVFGVASSTAQLGDDVAKTADKLGIGIAELQELRYAAERSGVATSAFDTALEKMTKNIGLALEGTGAQKDALEALGLSAANLATMSPEEALGTIADRLQDVETQAEKAALANDLFGRSGIDMLNMLRGGSRGLRDLRDDARRTGYVLSEQAARDAEVFQDTLLDTQLTLKGLKNTVGAALLPVVTQSMRAIGDALVANRAEVEAWSKRFASGLESTIPRLGALATGIGDVTSKIWEAVDAVAEMAGGYNTLGKIIAGVFAFRTIWKIGRFAWAIGSAAVAMGTLAASTGLLDSALGRLGARSGPGTAATTATGAGAGAATRRGGLARLGAAAGRVLLKGGAIGTGVALGLGNMELGDGTLTPEAAAAGPATPEQLLAETRMPVEERRRLGQTQEFEPMASTDARAAERLYAARVMGNLPTPDAMRALEADAAAARAEVAALQAQIAQIRDGPMAVALKAPLQMELNQRSREMEALEQELETAKGRASELTEALRVLGDAEITPEISAQSLDQALLKARKIAQTLRALEGATASAPPASDLRPVIRPQANARGGPFRPGWHLTGELGPELKFETRAGYVANTRALRQLAGYADRVGSLMDRPRTVPPIPGAGMDRAARVAAARNRTTEPRSGPDTGTATGAGAGAATRRGGLAAAAGPATPEQLLAETRMPVEERRRLGQTQEFEPMASTDARAAERLYAARVMGNLPTPDAMRALEADAAAARAEVAALQAQIAQIRDGPMAVALKAPLQMELNQRSREMEALEQELETAKGRASELTEALRVLGDAEITPEISAQSLDQALLKARKIAQTLRALEGATASAPPASDLRPVIRPQANARGGPFRPGWHLTGELGPELKFETRAGYVANTRALRQLAGYADRVGSLMDRPRTVPPIPGAGMDRAARVAAARNRTTEPRSGPDTGTATGAGAGAATRRGGLAAAGARGETAAGRVLLKGGAIGTGVALGLGNMELGDGTLTPEAAAAGPATPEQLLAETRMPVEERRRLGQTQAFEPMASTDARAAERLYAARAGALMDRARTAPPIAGAVLDRAAHGVAARNRATEPHSAPDTATGNAARVAALFASPGPGPRAAAAAAGPVTQNITLTIHAAGASAEEIMRLIERKTRQAAGNGLFDRAPATGPYGR